MNKFFFFVTFIIMIFPFESKANCTSQGRICSMTFQKTDADFLFVKYYYITQSMTFETEITTPGGDTVMHLVRMGTGQIVCSNDDALGLASNIQASPTSQDCGGDFVYNETYMLVIHSYSEQSSGKCDLKENGNIQETGVSFGGKRWNVDYSDGESFQAANKSDIGTELDGVMIFGSYTCSNPYIDYLRASDDDGVGMSPLIQVGTCNSVGGSGYVILGRFFGPMTNLSNLPNQSEIVVYRNDVPNSDYTSAMSTSYQCTNDADCDGLGDKLEQALGSCQCLPLQDPGCPVTATCPLTAATSKDTDGDGIPDSWEVFGRVAVYDYNVHNVELPRYGSNILHKDVFLEIDRDKSLTVPQLTETDLKSLIDAFSIGPANANNLSNPSGLPGIHLHIDAKNITSGSYKGSSYGDWGGSQHYDTNESAQLGHYASDISGAGRLGIFKLADRDTNGNGGDGSKYGYKLWFGQYVRTLAHELGHNLGLGHDGDSQNSSHYTCVATYPSIMSYAFQAANPPTKIVFSGGILPSINPTTLNELQGLGSSNIGIYSFLSNTAFLLGVTTNPQDSNYGAIDWDRNGTLSQSVAAFIGSRNDLGCATTGGGGRTLFDYDKSKITLNSTYEHVGISITYFNQKYYMVSYATNISNLLVYRLDSNGWVSVNSLPSFPGLETNIKPALLIFSGKLYIFYKTSTSGNLLLNYIYMDINNGVETFSPSFLVGGNPSPAQADGSLFAYKDGNKIVLYYTKDIAGSLIKRELIDGSWSNEMAVVDTNGVILKSPVGVPNILKVSGEEFLFMVAASTKKIWIYKKNNGKWDLVSDNSLQYFESGIEQPPAGNADIKVVYDQRTDRNQGFHILYRSSNGFYRITSTKYDSTKNPPFKFILINQVSNRKCDAIGSPALLANGSNLFASLGCGVGNLVFVKYADGIFNNTIQSQNDWKIMAKYMCNSINEKLNGFDYFLREYSGGSEICGFIFP